MEIKVCYLNEGKTYSQGKAIINSLDIDKDSIEFTTERKWFIYFYEDKDISGPIQRMCNKFIKAAFKYDESFILYVYRPRSWSAEWAIKGFKTLDPASYATVYEMEVPDEYKSRAKTTD